MVLEIRSAMIPGGEVTGRRHDGASGMLLVFCFLIQVLVTGASSALGNSLCYFPYVLNLKEKVHLQRSKCRLWKEGSKIELEQGDQTHSGSLTLPPPPPPFPVTSRILFCHSSVNSGELVFTRLALSVHSGHFQAGRESMAREGATKANVPPWRMGSLEEGNKDTVTNGIR